MTAEEDEASESALSKVLEGRDLFELFRPRREVTALLDELRRNPATRAILDGVPQT